MTRVTRPQGGTRWHAVRAGRWPLATLLKYAAALAFAVLFVWNLSLLAAVVQPVGRLPTHLLRGEGEGGRSANSNSLRAAAEAAAAATAPPPPPTAPSPPKQTAARAWFLNPQLYERDSGCDFSAAVAALEPDALEITCANIGELQLGEFLGQGFWREVYRATWKGREVAVKVVKEHLLNRSDIVTRHVEEVAAVFPVRAAPNIVPLVGWCNSTVIVDYVPQKLDELLYESRAPLSVRRALELALDAARGLAQLHGAKGGPFAHTDIQTRQFLVDSRGRLLLNDFNRIKYAGPRLAGGRPTPERCTFSTLVAKGKWRAPEEYRHAELDEKLDVYSLSLVLWSLQSREKPFEDLARETVYRKVPLGARPPVAKMKGFPAAMQDLIVRAWSTDPALRPSAAELVSGIEQVLADYRGDD